MPTTTIKIGVQDYQLVTCQLCQHDKKCVSTIKISFQLEGDFLNAAHTDDIRRTVDYEHLCHVLGASLVKQEDLNLPRLKSVILAFSHLITGGYIDLEVQCAHIFLKDRCLL